MTPLRSSYGGKPIRKMNVMQRTILTIGGDAFHLAERNDVAELCDAILDAAQNRPQFLDISIAGDGTKRVLVTPTSTVKIETIDLPDGHGPSYDAAHSEFDSTYFEYDLL